MTHAARSIRQASRGVLCAAAAALLWWCSPEAPAQSNALPTATLLDTLADENLDLERRTEAASRLLRGGRITAIDEAIAQGGASIAVPVALALVGLDREGVTPEDPTSLIQALGRAAAVDKGDGAIPIINALTLFHTRDAVRPVLTIALSEDASPSVRDAAFEALRRQSGRIDLGSNPEAWAQWWKEVEFLPEGQWRARVLEAQSRRADAHVREVDALRQRVVTLYRRLYGATPVERRPELLAELLEDERAALRRLGLELVDRELLNARVLGDAVRSPIIACLRDPHPANRAAAAPLVEAVAPEEAGGLLVAALDEEEDARVAAAMLGAGSRRITPELAVRAVRWLRHAYAPAGEAAAQALLTAWAEGGLDRPGLRNRTLERLRGVDPKQLADAERRLLAAAGTISDRDSLHPLLRSADERVRVGVARDLAPWIDQVAPLLQAAEDDDALLPIAIRAGARHGVESDVIAALITARDFSDDAALTAALEALSSLDARALVEIVSRLARKEATAPLLDALLERARDDRMRQSAVLLGVGRYDEASALEATAGLWLRRLEWLANARADAEAERLAHRLVGLSVFEADAPARRLEATLRRHGFQVAGAMPADGSVGEVEAASDSDDRG